MADIADLYDQVRDDISELVVRLEPHELDTAVPATPGWSIRDVVAHLAADATCLVAGDFPREFFAAFGEAAAVESVNNWTARQLQERDRRSLEELLQEWKTSAGTLTAMMRGEIEWPEGTLPFADRIVLTDAAVHQQDIFGPLGIERARDSAPVTIGLSGYIMAMGWRLAAVGLDPLRFDVGDKAYVAGDGEPEATVRASRFEFFRAMSGRRSPEQIRAYAWDGDADPYIPYFYPYGIRHDALVE
ncbi:MAG TPA: maleylpyruvate isomerase family mycothiol-dependent enzyme [Actinomycetota bacterium]|nr:maleylpyruvate isomerase family mycothiol-dependent enzyme [Actinomycetota bacterium]